MHVLQGKIEGHWILFIPASKNKSNQKIYFLCQASNHKDCTGNSGDKLTIDLL